MNHAPEPRQATFARNHYCRIFLTYSKDADLDKMGSYELPAPSDCCQLPLGYIDGATMQLIGY